MTFPERRGMEPAPIEEPAESLIRSAEFWEDQDPKCASLLRLLAANYPWLLRESEGRFAVAYDGTWGERILEMTFDSADEAIDEAEKRGIGYAGLVHQVRRHGINPSEVFVKAYPLGRVGHREEVDSGRIAPRRLNEVYMTQASVKPDQPQALSRFRKQ